MSRRRPFSKEIGVPRIGEAVNEMPLVEVQYRMMQAAELQIWRSFEWPCPLRHASLRRQHDLIGKLAIESALAVLSFAPCHMCVAAGRNRPQHDRVLELADIRLAAARGNRSDVGVAPIHGLWRVRLDIPPAGLVPGHDPSARALQRR
jgi:hypothetical protein